MMQLVLPIPFNGAFNGYCSIFVANAISHPVPSEKCSNAYHSSLGHRAYRLHLYTMFLGIINARRYHCVV